MSPDVRVVHALPRRVRVRAPALVGHRDACARIAERLAAAADYERVSVAVATGSVLVESDARRLDAAAIARAVDELVGAERDEHGRPLGQAPPPPAPTAGPTAVARAVTHAAAAINHDVRAVLGQHADLGTLLPIVFATGGVVEVIATGRIPAPTWFNLLWWSLRSFMTFNVGAIEDEMRRGNGAGGANGAANGGTDVGDADDD